MKLISFFQLKMNFLFLVVTIGSIRKHRSPWASFRKKWGSKWGPSSYSVLQKTPGTDTSIDLIS